MTVPDHSLKTWPEPFAAVASGAKRAEFRRDDRTPRFKAGDRLELVEYDPGSRTMTGRWLNVAVTHVARGPHIPAGFAMLSVEVVGPVEPCCAEGRCTLAVHEPDCLGLRTRTVQDAPVGADHFTRSEAWMWDDGLPDVDVAEEVTPDGR